MKKETYDPLDQVPRPDAVRIAVEQTETRLRKLRALLAASEAVETAGLRDANTDLDDRRAEREVSHA
ncbi:MAG: hypothetical protein AABP62_26900 [Planctomycetota bacterium]